MSRRGNPYDNAHVESFFKTLKHEEIFANDYSTIDDLHTLEFLRRPVAEGGVQASSIVYLLKEVGESVG